MNSKYNKSTYQTNNIVDNKTDINLNQKVEYKSNDTNNNY